MIKVILVDSNVQSRELIEKYIEGFQDVQLVFSFADINQIDKLSDIDLIIFDITSQNSDVILEKISEFKNKKDSLKFIATSYDISSTLVGKTLSCGVSDFLLKPILSNLLEASIKKSTQKLEEKAKIISVFSNKGGIGKTSIAINMAYEIQQQTQKTVCVLNLGINNNDVAEFLNIDKKCDFNTFLCDMQRSEKQVVHSMIPKYADLDLYILEFSESLVDEAQFASDRLNKIINSLKNIFDYLIIDTSSIINEFNVGILNNSDLILMVTTTNKTSIKNSQKCYEIFDKIGYSDDRIKLIVNRYIDKNDLSVDDIEKIFDRSVFQTIPNNYLTLVDAINLGKCVMEVNPQSNIAKAYKKMTEEILKIDFANLGARVNYNHGILNLLKRMGE